MLVNADEFASKYQSKTEVWRFLSTECKAYLPTYETVTIFHLRDLAANKRKIINCDDIKHINVPHFEGLKIEEMIKYAQRKPEIMRALPSE